MSRFSPKVLVAGALLLALGVLLTLRLTSTVTSPVGGFRPVGPGPAGPSATDLRGTWTPRVVLGHPVRASRARHATVEFRVPALRVRTSDGCNRYALDFTLDGTGAFHATPVSSTGPSCAYPPGGFVENQVALQRAVAARVVAGRLRLLGAGDEVLAVYDRAR